MRMINNFVIQGYAGRDAEMRYTPDGLPITNVNIGFTSSKKVGDAWENKTSWFRITGLGKIAESMSSIVSGDFVTAVCRVEQHQYEKDGAKQSTYRFTVNDPVSVVKKSTAHSAGSSDEQPEQERSEAYTDDDAPW